MARDVEKTIEDLEFLDEARVGAFEAAERTGFASAEALEKWLERHDAYDLWLAFKRRDAPGSHHKAERPVNAVPDRKVDPIIAVLDAADGSPRAATRRKAERVRTLLADLRQSMEAETEEAERKAAAKAEIERLERELAQARATLRGGSSASITVNDSVSAADLRAWAQSKGIPCPSVGRIPATVREQYAAESEVAS